LKTLCFQGFFFVLSDANFEGLTIISHQPLLVITRQIGICRNGKLKFCFPHN